MPNNIIITPGSASIQFSGSANNDTIRLQVEPSGSVAFYGNSGSLFSIVDQLSGSLMSVNDISGLPILEVFSDDRVVMGTFNQNTLVVTGSRVGIDKAVPTADLDISGSVFITGSLRISSGGITSSLFGTSSWANNSISSSFATNAISASYFSGSISFPNGLIVTGGLQATSVSASNGIIGNLTGTSSWASNAISSSFTTTASAATSITFTPTTASYALSSSVAVSSSFAISASWAPSVGGITSITAGEGLTGGTITSTGTIRLDSSSFFFADGVRIVLDSEGVVTSSTQINYTQLQNIPSGIVSSSTQVTNLLPTNVVSSSAQVDYTQLQNIPVGIISSSTQVNYSQLQNIPVGLVSSSLQINTGSFTGSFTGSLLGTGSWASSASVAISASRAVTASFAFTASTALLAQTASFFDGFISFPAGLDITGSLIVTGSQTITGSLNVTGGITGSLLGTGSWANNAISSSFATTASFAVSASWAPGGGLTTKAGSILNTSFTGNPRRAAVNFSTAFANTNYAVVITGEDARSWTVEGKVVGGFTASANSNTGLAGTTYWVATVYGES